MTEQIVRELLAPTRESRVIIVRRVDGRFTYRRQERTDLEWGPATIDAGLYDSADSAETEARQRIEWLRVLFN